MINGIVLVLFLSVIVTGQQIIRFQNAQSLKRDQEKGIFYAHFKVHHQHRLNVLPIKKTALRTQQECGQFCADTKTCFSFNVASVTNANNKLVCELLPTDIFNKSEKFGSNPSFHHFSIKTPCSKKPCKNGGSCVAKYEEDAFQCVCVPGYTGTHCETDINECVSSPCQNGGSCSDLVNKFVCACPPGYGGVLCEAVHGGYSSWGQWGSCDVSCGGGTRYRYRACTNPPPQHGGNDCSGLGSNAQTEVCNSNNCPIHGGYSSFGQWSSCSVACGSGTRSRSRSCTNPPPQYGGNDCSGLGSSVESEGCIGNNCPIDGGYSSWGQWSSCSVTCGGGTRSRSRTCTNPPPQFGGKDCSGLGSSSESDACERQCCSGGSCGVAQESRQDCGYYGISGGDCIARGCCHDDSVPGGIPHCYFQRCS